MFRPDFHGFNLLFDDTSRYSVMEVLGIYYQYVHGAYETRHGRTYKRGRKKHLTLYALDDYGRFFTKKVSQVEALIWRAKKRGMKRPKRADT